MALVKNITRISRNSRIQAEADCSYNTFTQAGQKYLVLSTYGSKDREYKGTVSQTLQLDRESAKQLYDIIKAEYRF